MGWSYEKLEKLGGSKVGRVVGGGAALIYVLGDELGEKLKRIGEIEDNPNLIIVGDKISRAINTLGATMFLGFIVGTLPTLGVKGVRVAASFTLVRIVG